MVKLADSPPKPRFRFRIPNTGGGAALVASGLAGAGFLIGFMLIIVLPMAESGTGVFKFFARGSDETLDSRLLQPFQMLPISTPVNDRPELWQTPTALEAFPSPSFVSNVETSKGSVNGIYVPTSQQYFVVLPTINDAIGRPVVTIVVALSADDDQRTPVPFRPEVMEPTQMTVATMVAGSPDVSGCILAIRQSVLQAVGFLGLSSLDDCREGRIRMVTHGFVHFGVQFEKLPNVRTRDGIWHAGGVFGRAQVWAILRSPSGV